jgi:hypothetical protein
VLDAAFKDVHTATEDQLRQLKYIDAASDGWRKKYCEQGAGLVNFCALTTTGALLHDVLNCSAVQLSTSWRVSSPTASPVCSSTLQRR